MRLLLDAHTLLWFCDGNASLSGAARAAIEDAANEKHVSLVTAWEVAIKVSLGKLKLSVPYEDLFPGAVLANGFQVLPTDLRHFQKLLSLPFHHRDPFDRLLIAQALEAGMTLVSCDPHFPAYRGACPPLTMVAAKERSAAKPRPLWSAWTCPRFRQATCRRPSRTVVQSFPRAAGCGSAWPTSRPSVESGDKSPHSKIL
jgi:PIN domain nuclease of toxin-antitoxin system